MIRNWKRCKRMKIEIKGQKRENITAERHRWQEGLPHRHLHSPSHNNNGNGDYDDDNDGDDDDNGDYDDGDNENDDETKPGVRQRSSQPMQLLLSQQSRLPS